jgi:ribosomal protein L37AE/L43A
MKIQELQEVIARRHGVPVRHPLIKTAEMEAAITTDAIDMLWRLLMSGKAHICEDCDGTGQARMAFAMETWPCETCDEIGIVITGYAFTPVTLKQAPWWKRQWEKMMYPKIRLRVE